MRSKICVYPELDIASLSFANGGPESGTANENVVTWMASQPAYARTTGGCKDDPDLVTVGSGSCSAAPTGMSCGESTPMRVCSPDGVDPEGNQCNWVKCGHGDSTRNRYFGGCAGDTTAGTLCCKN